MHFPTLREIHVYESCKERAKGSGGITPCRRCECCDCIIFLRKVPKWTPAGAVCNPTLSPPPRHLGASHPFSLEAFEVVCLLRRLTDLQRRHYHLDHCHAQSLGIHLNPLGIKWCLGISATGTNISKPARAPPSPPLPLSRLDGILSFRPNLWSSALQHFDFRHGTPFLSRVCRSGLVHSHLTTGSHCPCSSRQPRAIYLPRTRRKSTSTANALFESTINLVQLLLQTNCCLHPLATMPGTSQSETTGHHVM